MKRATWLLAAALIAAPAAAHAAGPRVAVAVAAPAPAPARADDTPLPVKSSRPEISLEVGLRGTLIPNPGFDPYASNDFLLQASAGAGLTVVRMGNASILLFAEYDGGTRRATARGQEASLALHRIGGAAETRFQLGRRFYLAARVAPAALHLRGSITDPTLDRPLVSRNWTWGLDASGGAGLLLGRVGARGARFWLTLDFGYRFAGESQMSYAPVASDEDPRKYGSVMLPAIRPAGPTSRMTFAVSF